MTANCLSILFKSRSGKILKNSMQTVLCRFFAQTTDFLLKQTRPVTVQIVVYLKLLWKWLTDTELTDGRADLLNLHTEPSDYKVGCLEERERERGDKHTDKLMYWVALSATNKWSYKSAGISNELKQPSVLVLSPGTTTTECLFYHQISSLLLGALAFLQWSIRLFVLVYL